MIYSPPVADALLSEIGGFAAQLAPWMMRLSLEPPPGSTLPATTGLSLHESSRWLWIAGLRLEAHASQQAPSEAARVALAAIPPNLPLEYRPIAATESVPELCQGVVTTSARLQHAAHAFARIARWSSAGHVYLLVPSRSKYSAFGVRLAAAGPGESGYRP